MNTRPKTLKHDSVSNNELALQATANRAFQQATQASQEAKKGLSDLARHVAELRDNDLWKHITNGNGKPRFRRWTEVAKCLYGGKSDRSYYELIEYHSLTQGDAAIPAEEVRRYGIKRAVEVARLKPEQRTPEIREIAKTEPVMVVRNPTERKPWCDKNIKGPTFRTAGPDGESVIGFTVPENVAVAQRAGQRLSFPPGPKRNAWLTSSWKP